MTWPEGQWEASKTMGDCFAPMGPPLLPWDSMAQTHRQTDRQTDMAILWLNRPSGADSVKNTPHPWVFHTSLGFVNDGVISGGKNWLWTMGGCQVLLFLDRACPHLTNLVKKPFDKPHLIFLKDLLDWQPWIMKKSMQTFEKTADSHIPVCNFLFKATHDSWLGGFHPDLGSLFLRLFWSIIFLTDTIQYNVEGKYMPGINA